MIHNKFYPLFFVSAVFLLSSCVYDKELTVLNDQVNALNRRVTALQDATDTALARDLEQIRSNQANVRLEIDELKGEVQDLSGRIEDNEHLVKKVVERDIGGQDALRSSVDDFSRRLAVLESAVKRHQEYLNLGPLETRLSPGEDRAQSDQRRQSSIPSEATLDPAVQEQILYDKALASYKEGRYEDAIEGFNGFLKRYPKSDRADNAHFWIGECHMNLKQYEQAILAYQNVIKDFPKGNKVPSALLRQAAAFGEIKDKTSSRLLLKKIINNYPKSNEAKIAQKRLETIK
ncbi:MAG: tol-pal system protein YbgF [Desulfatiglandales bacterium]